MTNPSYTTPNEYDFGEDFNYNLWTANTEVTLTNVPWNNDYRDVVRFESRSALNRYIDGIPNNKTFKGLYAKANMPIDLDIPFNVAQRYNYVRAVNPAQPIDGGDFQREFYYFVLDVQYMSPNNTRLVLQLDVWASFINDVQFGRAYVERGHVGVANKDHFRNNGRDYLAIPEGLDIGGEYVNVFQTKRDIMSNAYNGSTDPNGGYNVLVCSTVALERNPGDKKYPNLWTATGSVLQGLPSGASFYVFPTAGAFHAFLRNYSDKPWVTQGIISVTAIPKIHRYFPEHSQNVDHLGAFSSLPMGAGKAIKHDMFTDWRYRGEITNHFPPKYRRFRKFWTYPYMVIEVTTNTGNPLILKPESWNSPHASIREQASLVPPGQRLSFVPMSYNANTEPEANISTSLEPGEGWDMQTLIANFPTFAVVNNSSIAYLAQNARSIAYQFDSNDWSQSKALRGNQVGYDQATAGMNLSTQLNEIGIGSDSAATARQNQFNTDMTNFQNMAGIVTGIGMGGIGGAVAGPAGMLGGAALGGLSGVIGAVKGTMTNDMSVLASNDQLAIRSGSSRAANSAQGATGAYMRDSNKALADWAAKGDYANAIAGMNAKLQDAKMMQPSVSGQMGGDAFNLIHGLTGVTIKWKVIDQAAIAVIGDYWLRYGYAVQRAMLLPNDLAVMSRFTYWKLAETYIRSSRLPEALKQIIRGILEKGVTVWRTPDDIGIVDPAANEILPGISIDGYVPEDQPPLIEPTPEKPKRKRNKMLVYMTEDAVNKFALAGASPGTQANWQETESEQLAAQWRDATGQTAPVRLTPADFAVRKLEFLTPVNVVAVEQGGAA